MIPRWRFLVVGFLMLLVAGCSSTPKKTPSGGQPVSGTDEQIFIGDSLEKNYDPNVIMKRAESFFDKEDYPEAIIEYQHFLDLHRIHTLASYAKYKLAESYFKQVKTIDRDPEPIRKALEGFEQLRKEYPGSRYDADAIERIRACHHFLAEVHLMVGQFYYRREAYLAAAHRFERILQQYPDMDIAGDALYYLALTYNELGADDWAREHLIALADRFPTNAHARAGRRLLASLEAKRPPEAVALSTNQANGSASDAYVPANGISPHPLSGPPATPIATFAPTPNGSTETTLCRLGVWC